MVVTYSPRYATYQKTVRGAQVERTKAHFLVCFLLLLIYRILDHRLNGKFTCDEILRKLREMNFAKIEDQGYIPLYARDKFTDALHKVSPFQTNNQFITKRRMKEIQRQSKNR